ncbi:unnamed protein product [Caenorhabditis sp. 36 PRJEB53466]|nr:unnamed protein product [Caenorhabditis sp. 36 PRJEB53466]
MNYGTTHVSNALIVIQILVAAVALDTPCNPGNTGRNSAADKLITPNKEYRDENRDHRACDQTPLLDEFPDFPRIGERTESLLMLDEISSMATSIEDESAFDFEGAPNDDPFELPDFAEEAITIDEISESDRSYQAIMNNQMNVFIVVLEDLSVDGELANKNLLINGKLKRLNLDTKFGMIRNEVNGLMKSGVSQSPTSSTGSNNPCVTFQLEAPANSKITSLNVNVQKLMSTIHDEILDHLGAFVNDEIVTEKSICLTVNVQNSQIEILDKNRKKPLKLKIKTFSFELNDD